MRLIAVIFAMNCVNNTCIFISWRKLCDFWMWMFLGFETLLDGSITKRGFAVTPCEYVVSRHATFPQISGVPLFLVSVLPFKIETTIQNHWNCVISSFFWVKLQLRACESLTTGSFQNQHYHVLKKRYSHSVTANISLWIFIQLWDCVELFVCELARVTLPSKRESVCLFE